MNVLVKAFLSLSANLVPDKFTGESDLRLLLIIGGFQLLIPLIVAVALRLCHLSVVVRAMVLCVSLTSSLRGAMSEAELAKSSFF